MSVKNHSLTGNHTSQRKHLFQLCQPLCEKHPFLAQTCCTPSRIGTNPQPYFSTQLLLSSSVSLLLWPRPRKKEEEEKQNFCVSSFLPPSIIAPSARGLWTVSCRKKCPAAHAKRQTNSQFLLLTILRHFLKILWYSIQYRYVPAKNIGYNFDSNIIYPAFSTSRCVESVLVFQLLVPRQPRLPPAEKKKGGDRKVLPRKKGGK